MAARSFLHPLAASHRLSQNRSIDPTSSVASRHDHMIKILLIDHARETPANVRELLSVLETSNFEIECAVGYRDIMEGFRNHSYDVCVIDSAADNGLRLFAQARSVGFTAPIVLVTSNNAGEVIEAVHQGVADCLMRENLSEAHLERSICWVVEQARHDLTRSEIERRYLALLDNAKEIICILNLNGNVSSMNRAAEQLLGFSQIEAPGVNITSIVHPSSGSRMQQMIKRTLDAQSRTVEVVELVSSEGREISVEASVHPIYQFGKPVELQLVARLLSEEERDAGRDRNQNYGLTDSVVWTNGARQTSQHII